jgi:predicted peroxiredoxin
MPELTAPVLHIIVAVAEGGRLYAALEAGMAAAALGRSVRIFLQGEAAALLRDPVSFAGDTARRAAGQPDLAGMIDEARAMNIELLACQSGMALVGVAATDLVPHVRSAGVVSFMAEVGPGDRLIVY